MPSAPSFARWYLTRVLAGPPGDNNNNRSANTSQLALFYVQMLGVRRGTVTGAATSATAATRHKKVFGGSSDGVIYLSLKMAMSLSVAETTARTRVSSHGR